MAINWEGMGQNALVVGVLAGIGYMVYMKIKGKSSKIDKVLGLRKGGDMFDMRGKL